MNEYHLTVSTPSGTVFDGDAVFLSLRGAGGDLAVMAGHIPFVTTVKKCVCKVRFPDETEKTADCETGLLTVSIKTLLHRESFFDQWYSSCGYS